MKRYKSTTTYFLTEGKANLPECVRLSLRQAHRAGIPKVVIFTASGEGLEMACEQSPDLVEQEIIRLVGVSFAFGSTKPDALLVPQERQGLFERLRIPLIHAADPLAELPKSQRVEDNLVRRTLEMFSGGMALCIRAALVACDAGFVEFGEHIVSMSADTSVILKAVPSSHMFSALAIREIICKPIVQDVTRGETLSEEMNVEVLLQNKPSHQKALPPSSKAHASRKRPSTV